MNNIIVSSNDRIENSIYEIRGKQVMLDSDLARFYECSNGTKTINQAVGRHIDRFPEDFYFQLSYDEFMSLKSQVGTSSLSEHGGVRKLPYVFTEQGVAMLASVLRTKVAASVSVNIMRAFVNMRHFITNNIDVLKNLDEVKKMTLQNTSDVSEIKSLTIKNTNDIKKIQELFNDKKEKTNYVFYKGQAFDAYCKLKDIFMSSKKKLVIVDSYCDYRTLEIIKDLKVDVFIITKKNGLLTKCDIDNYNKNYSNLTIIYSNLFHDRFFIVDDITLYHCGASINYAGSRAFCINIISDKDVYSSIIDNVNSIIDV